MATYLIFTVGQTDVQLVVGGQRQTIDGKHCGELHDEIQNRGEAEWQVVDAPESKHRAPATEIPDGHVALCTPKLDAALRYAEPDGVVGTPDFVLILETTRAIPTDPRFAGAVVQRRLEDRGVPRANIMRVSFLTGKARLEDAADPRDAIVQREVVAVLDRAISDRLAQCAANDRVFIATTGGMQAANELINELVRLHAGSRARVSVLEVPDRDRSATSGADVAVEEAFHPATGYQARWRALALVERGSLLGAYGAVSHLIGAPGQEWTRCIEQLALFAASLPLRPDTTLPFIDDPRLAVRSALRVELALRAGDIPRAIHGTVAFLEAAVWDHIDRDPRLCRIHPSGWRLYRVKAWYADSLNDEQKQKLFRECATGSDKKRNAPFVLNDANIPGEYWIDTSVAPRGRLIKRFLPGQKHLRDFNNALHTHRINELRNDIAHDEPTPQRMAEARDRMVAAGLWSANNTFLSQPLVQGVLTELGVGSPGSLLEALLQAVRARLLVP